MSRNLDDQVGYQYVTLRCVPRIDREEFVNLGVVLYSQMAGFLEVGYRIEPARLKALWPHLDLEEIEDSLDGLVQVCHRVAPGLEKPGQRFGWLSAPRSTVVQPGPIHGGVTDNPAAELDRLLDRLVG